MKGYCSHPEASKESCGNQIIGAHTIQRRGGLTAISEEGHVISVKRILIDIIKNDREVIPREIGIGDASTFMGFCDHHDNEMFRPIEKSPISLDQKISFLLSFRALSYELFTKKSALKCIDISRETDKGEILTNKLMSGDYKSLRLGKKFMIKLLPAVVMIHMVSIL
jgi:hypothetical protein